MLLSLVISKPRIQIFCLGILVCMYVWIFNRLDLCKFHVRFCYSDSRPLHRGITNTRATFIRANPDRQVPPLVPPQTNSLPPQHTINSHCCAERSRSLYPNYVIMTTEVNLVRTGACLCKKITFRVEGQEINFAICHCTNCRRNCGATYTANAWFPDKVRWTWYANDSSHIDIPLWT